MFRPRLAESCSHWGSRSMLFPCWFPQWFVSKDRESHMNASFSTSGFSDAFRPGPRPRPCRVTHLATFPVRTRRPRRGDFGGELGGLVSQHSQRMYQTKNSDVSISCQRFASWFLRGQWSWEGCRSCWSRVGPTGEVQTRKLRDFVEIAKVVFAKVNLCRMVSHDF